MTEKSDRSTNQEMSRRGFLRASGTMAVVAGGAMAGCGASKAEDTVPTKEPAQTAQTEESDTGRETAVAGPRIQRFRTLGRTGFDVSDISMGCGRISESNVVRYAYDRGINLFDVAESYGNGDSERKIGQAMPHMDREKIFIVTKLKVEQTDTEQSITDRFGKCLERLNTNYADALYMHAVTEAGLIKHEGFHAAVARLKADGRLKHGGISSHGPHGQAEDSMEKVLLAAVEDGRFDVMLLVHNFMKTDEGERVLKACKEKNIGTTAMKTYAGRLEIEPFDPDNPAEEYAQLIEHLKERGMSREQAVERIQDRLKSKMEEMTEKKPAIDAFVAEHGVKTQEDLDKQSVLFVLGNPDMHTVCVSMPDFDKLDQFIPLSGTELSARGRQLLRDYRLAFDNLYCRHGCKDCLSHCPHGVPVSTVMRYTYYFNHQGREKHAMKKYAALGTRNGALCLDCDAPCQRGCPHGVDVQASLYKAHAMLTLV